MNQEIALSALRPGGEAALRRMETTGAARRRLRELGFVEGARVRCLGRSFGGRIAAYAVGGGVFALRDSEGDKIYVNQIRGGDST